MSGRDPELARGASETPDPLLELAGWHAEPMLLRRLNLYITEGILECSALAAAFVVNLGRLHETAPDTRPAPSTSANPLLVLQLLTIPLAVSAVRLAWSLSLFVGYHTFRGTATLEIIRRKGWLQRRSFWTHSATMISCLSCLTMMWHIMAFLLLQGYLGRSPEDEKKLLWSLLGIDIFCIVTHGCFWRDFVKNTVRSQINEDVDGERFHRLEQIYRMYRSKEISIRRYQEVSLAAGPNGSPTTCAICMEDFGHSDYLSVLPCGHYYHPACTNAWLCQKWACPLRCEVTPAGGHGKAAAQAAAPPAQASTLVSSSAALDDVLNAQDQSLLAAAEDDTTDDAKTPPQKPQAEEAPRQGASLAVGGAPAQDAKIAQLAAKAEAQTQWAQGPSPAVDAAPAQDREGQIAQLTAKADAQSHELAVETSSMEEVEAAAAVAKEEESPPQQPSQHTEVAIQAVQAQADTMSEFSRLASELSSQVKDRKADSQEDDADDPNFTA